MKALIKPIAAAVLLIAGPAMAADERASLEQLRETTTNLIDALVESGVLTREKADSLIREAERKAARKVKDTKPDGTIVVPYIPVSVQADIRESVKQDVMAQAKAEHWADPNAYPGWLDRVQLYGDVRARFQAENPAHDNTPASAYDQSLSRLPEQTTRDAKLATSGRTDGSTTDESSTMKIRARLGMAIRAGNNLGADVRIATGETASAISTNQTAGASDGGAFAKYSLWLDRAAIRYTPWEWMQLNVGRIANPWVTSDLIWDDDLNFDGAAVTFRGLDTAEFSPFATLGVFPMSKSKPPKSPTSHNLYGAQTGFNWNVTYKTRFRAALGYYDFRDIEGRREPNSAFDDVTGTALTLDYLSSEAQAPRRGNTLFRINALNDNVLATKWGYASKFRPMHGSLGLDFGNFDPVHLVMAADYVRNTAFSRDEIRDRTGIDLTDGKNYGYQLKFVAGMPSPREYGDWNVEVSYRYLGSDAVPDGLTDSDFGLGGTNSRGFTLGGAFGIDQRSTVSLRYLSSKSLQSTSMLDPTHKYNIDVLQADLMVRF